MIYDSKKIVPQFGSLAEAVHLLVWKSRVTEEFHKTRATAQAAIGGDKASEAFDDYRRVLDRRVEEKKEESMREKLDRLKDMKAISFKPAEGGVRKKSSSLKTVRRKR